MFFDFINKETGKFLFLLILIELLHKKVLAQDRLDHVFGTNPHFISSCSIFFISCEFISIIFCHENSDVPFSIFGSINIFSTGVVVTTISFCCKLLNLYKKIPANIITDIDKIENKIFFLLSINNT